MAGQSTKKQGRPFLADERRGERLVILLTAKEKAVLDDAAAKEHRPLAYIVREALSTTKHYPQIALWQESEK
jgi:hypothetical protein